MLEDIKEQLFFNGKVKFTTGITVYGHGHIIVGFGVNNALNNEEIIPIIPFFHLQKVEEQEPFLKIEFRIFPEGNEIFKIEVDPFSKTFKYKNNLYPTNKYYKVITGKEM